jgi:CRP/FNR family transcriptional regulator, cyclic AMP receptor protein
MNDRRLIRLDANDRARALANIPLFAGCDEQQVRAIADCAHVLSFDAGQTIVAEGEDGLGFYLLLAGSARVVRDGAEVARLGAGDFFGEVALIERKPRTASVLAADRTICLGILRSDFRPLLVRQPRIALRILDVEAGRLEG